MSARTRTWMAAALATAALLARPAPSPAEDVVPAYEPSAEVDAAPVRLPGVTTETLGNGLAVVYVPHHELPVVSVRLLVLAGGLYNPLDRPGATSFMGYLLTKGTVRRTAMEIADAIDFVGGSIDAGAGFNGSYVEASVLARDLDLALDLVADVARNPSFPDDEIERMRQQLLADVMYNRDDPGTIADEFFARHVYGAHPYAFPVDGTAESLRAMTRDDIVAQYQLLFDPARTVLVVAGDIDPRKVRRKVRKHFASWSGSGADLHAEDPVGADEPPVLVVDKPGAVQSQIRIGYLLAPLNMGEDTYAFKVMNYCFGGGGFSSRLMQRIRADLGLTYGIYSSLDSTQRVGAFTVSSFTKTESTGELIDEVLAQMRLAIDEGFTEEELAAAKAYLVGSYPASFETPGSIASQLQSALLFGFGDPVDHVARYRERIGAVTLEQVNAMAREALRPDQVRITVVGASDEIAPQVEHLGDVAVVSMP